MRRKKAKEKARHEFKTKLYILTLNVQQDSDTNVNQCNHLCVEDCHNLVIASFLVPRHTCVASYRDAQSSSGDESDQRDSPWEILSVETISFAKAFLHLYTYSRMFCIKAVTSLPSLEPHANCWYTGDANPL